MKYSSFKQLLIFTMCYGLSFVQGVVHAADTEIYFSTGTTIGESGEVIRPNVLFILDTSGSMTRAIPQAGGLSRVDVMKDAMRQVLEDLEDVNVGLMRYTNDDGGPVLFPISYIDGDVGEIVSENAGVGILSFENSINDGSNDGEENLNTNSVALGETILDYTELGATHQIVSATQELLFQIPLNSFDAEEDRCGGGLGNVNTGSSDLDFRPCTLVGIRFSDVDDNLGDNDLRNALITAAFLDFYIDDKRTTQTDVRIFGEASDDPIPFNGCNSSCDDISTRPRTTAFVDWPGLPASDNDEKISSPDITEIVQEIVSRGCVNSPSAAPDTTGCTYANDNMAFVIETLTGNRDLISKDNGSRLETELRLIVEVEETQEVPGDSLMTGFRFENIKIPQGARITEANLVLTPSANSGNNENTTWEIKAELNPTGNSPRFVTLPGNFSSRILSSSAFWNVPDFNTGVPVETTDNSSNSLKDILQEVVNQENWCGGNALSLFVVSSTNSSEVFRETESFEGNTGVPTKLKYSFESGSEGCYAASETAQTAVEGDDAEQDDTGGTNIFDLALDLGEDTVGVRFQGVDIPQNARILEADILFSARNSSGGFASFNIKGELPPDGNANIFRNNNNNISNRNFTSTLPWIPEEWTTGGELYATPDLSTIVQAMVDNNNWEAGNAMVFVMEPGTGTRLAESYNSDPSKGPRLRIRYEDIAPTQFKTVRDRLIEVIDDLPADGNTPITETMYEAALYWRGEDVKFGINRDDDRTARISHPGSYCITNPNDTLDCRGADVNNNAFDPGTNRFGVQTPDGCNPGTNPNDSDCADENIKGEPTYISPFNSELTCQNNYQILLTDGAANSSSGTSRNLIRDLMGAESCLANNSTIKTVDDIDHNYPGAEQCSVDLVKYLNEEDQSTADIGENLKNRQIVRTHTIAFNLDDSGDQQFLKDMANVGDGNQYTAVTAGELTNVFNNILTEVRADPTSFVSPSLATNAFNRLLSRDEVYFGLFTPQLNTAWPGNVKKYGICIDSTSGCELGRFLDANGDEAIDAADDKFKITAQSFWSDDVDGRATTEGGYGAEVTDFTQSVIYTEIAQGMTATPTTPLSNAGYQLTSANWAAPELVDVRNTVCPVPSTTAGSDCEDRMLWLLGKVIDPDLETDISGTQRWTTNDVLHSSPTVLTYGGIDDDGDAVPGEPEDTDGIIDSFFDKIIAGTNDGSLHMINGSDGSEEWRFIPSDFLEQQQTLFTDPQATHIYGLDLTPTVLNNDVDGNGIIETADGDFIKVYVGTRRGGKFLYALDLSADISSNDDTVVPKFLWKIEGGITTGFERLAYTWSQPRLADINTTTGVKNVLILGGGFDMTQDTAENFSPADNGGDFLGNAIFIVDPETGEKILSISGAGSGADIEIPEMQYSIPSRISIIDTNGDGIDDRLYVGDTGAQIWRVDLGSDIQATGGLNAACLATDPATCTSTIVGRLANLSDTSVDTGKRRFFEPPAVVQVRDAEFSDQTDYDYILIGSGYRAHPLNTSVNDRFYAVRDRLISPLLDDDGDHYAELTDGYADGSGSAITNTGLINATSNILDTSDATREADGWFFDFTEVGFVGEKVLSTANAIAGGVSFTTFRPGNNAQVDPCEGTVGNSTAYNFNILNANAFLDWEGDGDIDIEDRSISLGGGIPSEVVPVFTQEGVVGIVGIEGGASQLGVLSDLPRFRTYWYEE